MRSFFLDAQLRGPTAARGLMAGLQWLARHLGFSKMPLASPIVEQFGQPTAGHLTVPRSALPLKVWAHLIKLGGDGNMTVRIAAGLVLRVVASGLRFAHATRATLVADMCTPRMQVWHIAKGKSGNRAAFRVSTPTYIGPGAAFFSDLQESIKIVNPEAITRLVPDMIMGDNGIVGPLS